MEALFTTIEFNLVVTIILFAIFLYAGYKSEKKSGGFFLVFAGFILIHSIAMLIGILPVLSLMFMSPLSLYLIFIGFYKFLYSEKGDEKGAGNP